jgi:hypothetical protein
LLFQIQPVPLYVKTELARIKEGNAVLRKALEEQYKPGRDSQLMAEGKGQPVDGLEMWKKRLALYDPDPPSFANTIEVGLQLHSLRVSDWWPWAIYWLSSTEPCFDCSRT